MYGPEALARRRCRGTPKDGQPCRAWACWGDPEQRCQAHAGRHHHGPLPFPPVLVDPPTRYPPCTCPAYAWPNLEPHWTCQTPAGTHDWPRLRRPAGWPSRRQMWERARRR
jgi:hypothetical protein